jgi:transposase
MTRELEALRDWLKAMGVTHVGMESTGVYWRPVHAVLEGHFELIVGNARHIRNVPGRKTDVKDAEWIAELVRHGLIAKSFVPSHPLQDLRELLRYRRKLVESQVAERNRIQALDLRIAERPEPCSLQHVLLMQIPGVDWVVAAVLIAEIGVDMSVFLSVHHLAAWAGVCPGNHESAGKQKSGRARKAGRLAAELAEPRPGTKGNAGQQSTHRAQSRARVTQALDRVRRENEPTFVTSTIASRHGAARHAPPSPSPTMTRSRVRAGPVGERRWLSYWRMVSTVKPKRAANASCDSLRRRRNVRTSSTA